MEFQYSIGLVLFGCHQKNNYFKLHGTAQPSVASLCNHRFFYWDPDYLVNGGLKCPCCGSKLKCHGFTRPRQVVDLHDCFYMIGQRHLCPKCKNEKSGEISVTFNSWDERIMNGLPDALVDEFPAYMSYRGAIAYSVFALMQSCFQYGLGSKQFSNCLQVLHRQHYDKLQAQYLSAILARQAARKNSPETTFQPFSVFDDPQGYGGFCPSAAWLRTMYDSYIKKIQDKLDQKAAMLDARVCALDHSHKITKQVMKVDGESIFCAALTVTNDVGEARVVAFVATKSHAQFESALVKVHQNLHLYGHQQPEIFYTDKPAADKQFLEHIFPSLLKDTVPIEKCPGLKPFVLSPDSSIRVYSNAAGINDALAKITDDLNLDNIDEKLVIALDTEWNVIFGKGSSAQPTAILQIAYKSWFNIFQIGHFKGNLPTALKNLLANPQIIKAGRNVAQDLKRLEKECK